MASPIVALMPRVAMRIAVVVPVVIAFAVLMLLSFASLDGLRRSLLLRTALVPVLAVGAPLLLMYGSTF